MTIRSDEQCQDCSTPYTVKDIDGGRCLTCGAMITAEHGGTEAVAPSLAEATRGIDEIIEAQGWNDSTLIELLFSFCYDEGEGSLDALRTFLAERAAKENAG